MTNNESIGGCEASLLRCVADLHRTHAAAASSGSDVYLHLSVIVIHFKLNGFDLYQKRLDLH